MWRARWSARDARRVTSTLDAQLQAFALDAVKRQLATLGQQNVADAAVLVVDNASGEVLAYVGNSGSSASAPFVDGVRAARQAGSTLKPFLYELAIEQRLLTAASLLDDSPVNIVTPGGLYVPQNYDRDFKGMVSLRTALSSSLNVPAVRTLTLLEPEVFAERLASIRLRVPHPGRRVLRLFIGTGVRGSGSLATHQRLSHAGKRWHVYAR